MKTIYLTISLLVILSGCSSISSDPRSDASQPMITEQFNTPVKDDDCCLKFSSQGLCLQKKSAGCSKKDNLNIQAPQKKLNSKE